MQSNWLEFKPEYQPNDENWLFIDEVRMQDTNDLFTWTTQNVQPFKKFQLATRKRTKSTIKNTYCFGIVMRTKFASQSD